MTLRYLYAGASGTADASSWANAYTTLIGKSNTEIGNPGDTMYAAHDHSQTFVAETQLQWQGGQDAPIRMICVNRGGNVPPQESDLRSTAVFQTSGNGNRHIKINDNWYVYGCAFRAGVSATDSCQVRMANGYNVCQILDTCILEIVSTGSGAFFSFSETGQSVLELRNTQIIFGAAGQKFKASSGGVFRMFGGSIAATGAVPDILIDNDDQMAVYEFYGVDLSTLGGKKILDNPNFSGYVRFVNCLMPSTPMIVSAGNQSPYRKRVSMVRCGASGVGYDNYFTDWQGEQTHDVSLYTTGLEGDGVSPFSIKCATKSWCNWLFPFNAEPMQPFNATAGANRTVTVEGIRGGSALPNTDEVWFDLQYMGSNLSPVATTITQGKPKITAAVAQAASTKAWTSTTNRANSTTYANGAKFSVSSAPGLVFMVTAGGGGNSAGSLPGGYATAVDGDTITDGALTVKAMYRFKLTATLSAPQPQLIGPVTINPKCGAASDTVWIDPKPSIT